MKNGQSDTRKKAFVNRRERRYCSESVRRLIVEEIENGLSKSEAARRYQVSEASIFKWVAKYSKHYEKRLKTVVEHESDSMRLKQVEAELKSVYERLGRERAKSMFFEELIDTAGDALGLDLKKSFGTLPSNDCAKSMDKSKTKTK